MPTRCLVMLASLLAAALAQAQPPRAPDREDPEAAALRQRMLEAYADVNTYEATVHLAIQTRQGRWLHEQSTEYHVAVDRQLDRMLLDRPELLLVSDGSKLRIRSDAYPGRYVEVNAPKPLAYGALVGLVPFIGEPPLPAVVPLLSSDPIAQLAGGPASVHYLAPDPANPADRPGLRFDTAAGVMTLLLDPASHLVSGAILEMQGFDPSVAPVVRYEVRTARINQPIDASTFQFHPMGDTAVASIQQLTGGQTAGGAAAGAATGATGGAAATPMPQAAPPISLKTLDGQPYESKDEKARVIVLDFWATWCPPCRESLPKLEDVVDWAQRENKSVAIFAVNLGESQQQVRQYLQQQKLSLPVLMDPSSAVGDAYGVQAIPHTVIIADGKIAHVHVGYQQDMADLLKQEIEALLTPTP